MKLQAIEVFTPNDYPKYTYVQREGEHLEERLAESLRTPKQIVSLSGPSKSGKTVLVERIVPPEHTIKISGAEIRSPEGLWELVLDNLDEPTTATDQTATTESNQGASQAAFTAGLFGVANANVGQTDTTGQAVAASKSVTRGRGGMQHVADKLADSKFIVFIDDFHYIESSIQTSIARQIKAGSERGIRIVVAVVPHRSDDVVRTNAELRGRVQHIDTAFWSVAELKEIALKGFRELHIEIGDALAEDLANEACGSPQLMQTICLQACFAAGIDERSDAPRKLPNEAEFKAKILERSSTTTDYSSLVRALHRGAATRGTERNTFKFTDGSAGDVYRAVLLAIAQPPPRLNVDYSELMARVEKICVDGQPVGSSVNEACQQLAKIAKSQQSQQRTIEWDNRTLTIVDPYLLFYLRSSHKLEQLGRDVA